MNTVDVVIVVAVVVVVGLAIWRFAGSVSGTRDCCSGKAKNPGGHCGRHGAAAARVADTDPSHYAHAATLEVGGMTCEHCVANVEAALDGLGGTWATAELTGGRVLLRSKDPISEERVRVALEGAGYRLVSLRRE